MVLSWKWRNADDILESRAHILFSRYILEERLTI